MHKKCNKKCTFLIAIIKFGNLVLKIEILQFFQIIIKNINMKTHLKFHKAEISKKYCNRKLNKDLFRFYNIMMTFNRISGS